MAWVKAKWIDALFNAFNLRFPRRDKSTDGTIGDPAHQGSKSGHNPDDTPGSKPEREDADAKPEVRAADVDADLRDPGVTMEHVVQAILATPRDRDRFIYIIYNRRIWRKVNGWRQERYDGSDPHTSHPHFSGDPAYDEDGHPFLSILNLGGDMSAQAESILVALASGLSSWTDNSGKAQQMVPTVETLRQIDFRKATEPVILETGRDVKVVKAQTAGSNTGGVTQDALVEALVVALQDPRVQPVLRQAAFEGAQQSERE